MRVVQVSTAGGPFELVERPVPAPHDNEVLIRVEACGVCRGDAVVKEGGFPGLTYPRVPGHEVVGVVEKAGGLVEFWKPGARVGVGWSGGHCMHCERCRRGDFGACAAALTTGVSTDGGYGEFMTARAEALVPMPGDLDAAAAAPLVCAGNTTFSALRNAQASPGDLVAIHGLGGLGHLAVRYARAMGFRTAVISRGRAKETLAMQLGADVYIDATATDAAAALRDLGGASLVLCTAPDGAAISALVDGLARRGRLVVIAFTRDMLHISAPALLLGERSIAAAVGGNCIEDTIAFSRHAHIEPMVETYPLERASEAYEAMRSSRARFRAVLQIAA